MCSKLQNHFTSKCCRESMQFFILSTALVFRETLGLSLVLGRAQSSALLRIIGKLQTSAERSRKRVISLFGCRMHCSYMCSAGGAHHVCYFRTGVFWPALSSKVHYMLPCAMTITERTVQAPLSFQFLCPL